MYINVKNLKESVNSLKTIVDNYQENSINLNNNLLESKNHWFGDKSSSFFNKINDDNSNVKGNILELNELLNIYDQIIFQYSNIGCDINFDLEKRDSVNNTINNYFNYIDSIINLYDSIPSKFIYLIQNQRKYFVDLKKYLFDIKNQFNLILDNIKNIEDNLSSKLLKYNFEIIKESDISMFM